MLLSFCASLLIFCGVTLGLAWPLVTRLALDPAEKLTTSVALSLLGLFLFSWMVYVETLPLTWLWLPPALAVGGLIIGWRPLAALGQDPDARSLMVAQLIITSWSVGCLALVRSYSGGIFWVADWWGHLQRTWFFLDRGPRDILFNGFDALTSRPPLANVVNGALLQVTQRDFAHYQFFSTLFSSLVFLPAGLLARRFGGRQAIAVLALLFMINPMFAQNATYAWTKLPAAFFVLVALYFFLKAQDDGAPMINAVLFSVSLAAGLLTHYSTGPYAVILGTAWFAFGWSRRHERAWCRITAIAAGAGTVVLATWFGWTLSVYGPHGTFLTNSSATDRAPSAFAQLQVMGLNLRDTLVPHFLRTMDFQMLAQSSTAGWWHDWFFQLYQINFFFIFGSLAWIIILVILAGKWRTSPKKWRTFWLVFIGGNVVLGVAVHGARDVWGLAHICLQPLVLVGLACLAAAWPKLARPWQLLLVIGAAVDFLLGLVLHFGVENNAFDRWLFPGRTLWETMASYSSPAQLNFYAKEDNHWRFVGDLVAVRPEFIMVLLALLFLLATARAGRRESRP